MSEGGRMSEEGMVYLIRRNSRQGPSAEDAVMFKS